jgi:hypothetical protein
VLDLVALHHKATCISYLPFIYLNHTHGLLLTGVELRISTVAMQIELQTHKTNLHMLLLKYFVEPSKFTLIFLFLWVDDRSARSNHAVGVRGSYTESSSNVPQLTGQPESALSCRDSSSTILVCWMTRMI